MEKSSLIYILCYVITIAALSYITGDTYRYMRLFPKEGDASVKRLRNIHKYLCFSLVFWVISHLLYIPKIIGADWSTAECNSNSINFILSLAMIVPMAFKTVMYLLAQNMSRGNFLLMVYFPAWIFLVLHLMFPAVFSMGVILVIVAIVLMSYVYYVYRCYRRYIRLIRKEYSDLSNRDLSWAWYVVIGFMVQSIMFVLEETLPTSAYNYCFMVLTIVNATGVVYFSRKVEPISENLAEEENADFSQEGESMDELDPMIETLLKERCENSQLFLDPMLTRDRLCSAVGINRNRLSNYFRILNTDYYQYINSLRIHYACHIIASSTDKVVLSEVATNSGFSNDRTFRSAFSKCMNMTPSEFEKQIQSTSQSKE